MINKILGVCHFVPECCSCLHCNMVDKKLDDCHPDLECNYICVGCNMINKTLLVCHSVLECN